jgi:hypothetical protein
VIAAPSAPIAALSVGVTGHRETNPTFAANRADVAAAMEAVMDALSAAGGSAPVRLHTLLVDGVDQLAAASALARGWALVAPLPFGARLNAAINARPGKVADARAILAGRAAADAEVRDRAEAIHALGARAHLFELADRDGPVTEAFLAALAAPRDRLKTQFLDALVSARVELAARVMIEQSDLLIAIWDGATRDLTGGVGHTIDLALNHGCPVVWIDARAPAAWRLLQAPEELAALGAAPPAEARDAALASVVRRATAIEDEGEARRDLAAEAWKARSHPLSHAYRRIEALLGGDGRPFRSLSQTYETPDQVAGGSGAELIAALGGLPGGDPALAGAVEAKVLRRFAWADGVSSRLSDVYRGGMTASFVFSAAAALSGVIYLPFVSADRKGAFTLAEFLLLAAILAITALGQRRDWHTRWFQTRRVAEYLRHSAILLALGVARAPGRWPRGADAVWPEAYARQGLREVGLPAVAVTPAYLRATLEGLLLPHVRRQRAYHAAKVARLTHVHERLDQLSAAAFILAVLVVAAFLAVDIAEASGVVPHGMVKDASKWFTLLGVALPTLGASIAGVRYFGDFERFAAISEVTAEKLQAIEARIAILLAAPDDRLGYDGVSELAHEADEVVVTEIERWQSVFGGKHITVPV